MYWTRYFPTGHVAEANAMNTKMLKCEEHPQNTVMTVNFTVKEDLKHRKKRRKQNTPLGPAGPAFDGREGDHVVLTNGERVFVHEH
jgi:hypothetical protein